MDVREILRQLRAGQSNRATVDNFSLAAEAQKLSLTAQLPDDLAPVQADADRVAQVLRNLLVNALRHTPPGGSVTVSASCTIKTVEITIADTGVGIAPEDISQQVSACLWPRAW